jgi:hypothetical protein
MKDLASMPDRSARFFDAVGLLEKRLLRSVRSVLGMVETRLAIPPGMIHPVFRVKCSSFDEEEINKVFLCQRGQNRHFLRCALRATWGGNRLTESDEGEQFPDNPQRCLWIGIITTMSPSRQSVGSPALPLLACF